MKHYFHWKSLQIKKLISSRELRGKSIQFTYQSFWMLTSNSQGNELCLWLIYGETNSNHEEDKGKMLKKRRILIRSLLWINCWKWSNEALLQWVSPVELMQKKNRRRLQNVAIPIELSSLSSSKNKNPKTEWGHSWASSFMTHKWALKSEFSQSIFQLLFLINLSQVTRSAWNAIYKKGIHKNCTLKMSSIKLSSKHSAPWIALILIYDMHIPIGKSRINPDHNVYKSTFKFA